MPDEPYFFTDDDRQGQLRELSESCAEAARLLRQHGEVWHADVIGDRGLEADRLLVDGYTREDLNTVASQFPSGPAWTDPRAADYNGPRQPWQDRVARLLIEAQSAAQNLRATARYFT